jgi:uncharacterized membrane protein affecting hemolysin expression
VIITIKVEVGLDRDATAIMNGIRNELTNIAIALEKNMATFQDLTDQVKVTVGVEQSAVVAIQAIAIKLQELINSSATPEQLQALVDDLAKNTVPLAEAVAANPTSPPPAA